jgi:hypothetical protein
LGICRRTENLGFWTQNVGFLGREGEINLLRLSGTEPGRAHPVRAGGSGQAGARYSHELALLREKEIQQGNKNRATLAVARKLVAYMLAVDRRKQDFVPAEELAAKAVA